MAILVIIAQQVTVIYKKLTNGFGYKSTVDTLSENMNLLAPGRKAMLLAATSAMAQLAPSEKIIKKDKIIEDIKKAKADGLLVPKICDALLTTISPSGAGSERFFRDRGQPMNLRIKGV